MKVREKYIDIAKAIGIITVVIGHTDFEYKQFIYQFHVPLFFFLSGIVFNAQKAENFKQFVLNRIKGLYLPFVLFELLFLALHNILGAIGIYSVMSDVKLNYDIRDYLIMTLKIITMGGGEQLVGPLWFLIPSFEIVIIFGILTLLLKNMKTYKNIIMLIVCLILYFVGCYTDLPRLMSQAFIGIFFFCCGYLYQQKNYRILHRWPFATMAFIVILICSQYNTVDIANHILTYKWMLILSAVSGCYLVIFLSKKLEKIPNKLLLFCGQNTIIVLALHCISFKLVMLIEIAVYNLDWRNLGLFPVYQINEWWGIILTMAGILLPLSIKVLLAKSHSIPKALKVPIYSFFYH